MGAEFIKSLCSTLTYYYHKRTYHVNRNTYILTTVTFIIIFLLILKIRES